MPRFEAVTFYDLSAAHQTVIDKPFEATAIGEYSN